MRLRLAWTLAVCATADAPVVIAHRGGAAVRPENTLAAFRHSIGLRVGVLEFDMNLTADDQVVIHHDSAVSKEICKPDPGSGVAAGPIRGLTLAQIRKFECGSFAREGSPRFQSVPGERMPTLDEFLMAVKGSSLLLLGETKMPAAGDVPPDRFVELIDKAIRKHGVAERFVLQSSDDRTTDAMRKSNAAVGICLLNARKYKPNYLATAQHGATHIMLRFDDATPEQIRELKTAGLVVYSGTANRSEDWLQYAVLQFDGILTDDPVGLREFLRSRQPR